MKSVTVKFKKGGDWYEGIALRKKFFGLLVLVKYQAKLDYGMPVFSTKDWIWKWRVKPYEQ